MIKDSNSVILNNSPENSNLELLHSLRKATEGLVYLTESDAPYEIYLWETAKLGELNLETLLNTFGYSRELNSNEFDEFINGDLSNLKHLQLISNNRESIYYGTVNVERQVIKNFRNILSQINPYLTNIKILRLMDFYILISNTPSSGLLGISTDFNFEDWFHDYRDDRELCLDDLAAEDRKLASILDDATSNICLRPSDIEEIYFVWRVVETKRSLFENLIPDMTFMGVYGVGEEGFDSPLIFDSFLENDEDRDRYQKNVMKRNVKEMKNREKEANDLVELNLTNLKLYQIYNFLPDYEVNGNYILYYSGQAQNGDQILIKTGATWT